ncbi:AtuA-related protein [Candidatus Palauibacter sp.]|uniref:AtuA-related protein n=1 Tax=Candidatus Palauibacter sp. TaxID=3101350 RepID=UPI003B02C2E3
MRVRLGEVAFARSGDKGDTANIGLIALFDDIYPLLKEQVTADRVRRHFKDICEGDVERFELPNLRALNFLLHRSLGGGGTVSLMLDAQGKTFSTALLRMEVDIPEEVLRRGPALGGAGRSRAVPPGDSATDPAPNPDAD